jgi:diguanylate cyclase (GGDEF)-like protein
MQFCQNIYNSMESIWVMKLNREYHSIVTSLKVKLFDLLVESNEYINFKDVGNKLAAMLQGVLEAKDVTLYLYNEWLQSYIPEVSTAISDYNHWKAKRISKKEAEQLLQSKNIVYGTPGINSFYIPLVDRGRMIGILQIDKKNKEQLLEEEELCNILAEETSKFLRMSFAHFSNMNERKRYEKLYRVTAKFHSSMNMDDVLAEIISTLQEVYPAYTYYLLLSHDNSNNSELPIKDLHYDSHSQITAALQAYVTGNVQIEDSLKEKRSVLYAPLKGKQGVYGVLEVIAPSAMIFPKDEIKFISLLANTAGSALENAKLYQHSKRLISDLLLINETSHRLNSNLRLTEAMSFMSNQIMQSFQADEVGFILFNDNETYKILSGSTPYFTNEQVSDLIEYIKAKIFRENEPLFIGDTTMDSKVSSATPYRSLLAVPMIQSGKIKGVSIVLHRKPYYFTFENFKLLQSLIHHFTLSFTNSMLREELEKMVITDYLTKLYTRSYLDEKIKRSMTTDGFGSFILIDIDNFKQINDTYGHQVGDEVLIQVANLIKMNIRETDIGARWGGEELAIYLPRVDLNSAVSIANRLVDTVEKQTNPKITISCGVAFWSKEKADSIQKLFNRADKALYKAKNDGKNRVIIYDGS